MAEITASLVKELREKTGAGMMDCKKALTETDGNLEEALDWLRKKGLSAAAKKAGRTAAEGLVAVVTESTRGAILEVNAETDFVSRNDQFQEYVNKVAGIVLEKGADMEALAATDYPGTGRNVADELTQLIATIGENMSLRRAEVLSVDKGVVSGYIHSPVSESLGRIGVIVALESEGDQAKLADLGKQLAMHVAAASPMALDQDSVDTAILDREREVLADQARASGKPEDIINKMVEGRLRKFYEESVLLEQTFVIDGESKVSQVLEQAEKDVGAPVKLTGFVRYQLGEGIEKQESDFASEVAAAAGN
ncbi:translation elongation factor Ts [Fodinicurvata halophila]|uniref:Elongation factor Ts n=1 Tax=Fodinicurvata halophila TaxID=1419723 RepID=A0ABV8ULW5_9PROT